MRRVTAAGFTLIELMIVIGIIALLAAVLVPAILPAQDMAYALADRRNLERHYQWLLDHKRRLDRLPMVGGHEFVLSTWTSGVAPRTLESFDCYWTPGPARSSDPHYHRLREAVARGEDPWPSLAATTSLDTGYAGRAAGHLRSMEATSEEALLCNDNEFGWSLRDGTVNLLFNSGVVRSYSYQVLREIYGLGPFDPATPVVTAGAASPIPYCRKLER